MCSCDRGFLKLESKLSMNNNSNNKIVTNTIKWNSEIINNFFFNSNCLKCTTLLTRLHRAWHVCKIHADKSLNYSKLYEIWYSMHITSRKLKLSEDWQLMALDQTRFRNLFSLYPISRFVCFESETEMNPRMQLFVRNPREGQTKIIRNIPVTTDKLIYELVIYSGIWKFHGIEIWWSQIEFTIYSNAILNIKIYSCIFLGLKIT